VNDLVDLEADRLHPKKCKRPFASGTVPLTVGMLTGLVLVSVALGVGAYLGPKFLAITLLYVFVSVAYSMRLKRMRWVDIILLASLYSVRVVAGAAAAGVAVSGAMLFFIFPVFLTLGAVKRLTELTLATNDERLPGRGYGRPDRGKLLNFAVVSMISALLIFFIYSQSAQAMALYPDRWFLWLAILPLAAWLFRMVRLGYYGKQDYDPIVFALSDKRGIGLILITLSLMFYAAGLWAQWFGF
jgi:4-hydroxybenzoate polyprenyltransferase